MNIDLTKVNIRKLEEFAKSQFGKNSIVEPNKGSITIERKSVGNMEIPLCDILNEEILGYSDKQAPFKIRRYLKKEYGFDLPVSMDAEEY